MSSARVLEALQAARAEVEAARRARNEPIAIVGLGCRFPGGADSPEGYWRLLRDGVDAVVEIPRERWDVDRHYDPDPDAAGKSYVRRAALLERVDGFDARFFGIAPREVIALDPQERLLLEVAWEALEHAGIAADGLAGSRTGVFVGIGEVDYVDVRRRAREDPLAADVYDGTGTGICFASGRLSYVLGLQGPNLTLDTACSASLVAVHLACQSLRLGEADLALAGGVHLMLTPDSTMVLCRARALSPGGACRVFAADADGYVRGEGAGVIVLKRLAEAQRDGDRVLAVIRGSAINHDGRTAGLTVPNGLAQQALMRQALASAGIAPDAVSYIEAHGTGTPLGDPIEMGSIGAVYAPGPRDPLVVGAVKASIGHLEAAAGVAGLIKVVLALEHGEIPPQLHFGTPNPLIAWATLPVEIPRARRPWPAGARERVAAVSAFGFSGTNAHVVVGEAPRLAERPDARDGVHVLPLSARSVEALAALCARYEGVLAEPFADACHTAGAGRRHFAHRLAVVARDAAEARTLLGARGAGVYRGTAARDVRLAALFPGQGAQFAGMGAELWGRSPVRDILARCQTALAEETPTWSLEAVLRGDGLDLTAHAQPALYAIECALWDVWRSWGVELDAVLGHSVGEFAAAYAAGVVELEEGARLVAARGRLMATLCPPGAMAAVRASADVVEDAIAIAAVDACVAAANGPETTVVAGTGDAVAALTAALAGRGIASRRLAVSHAFHSPLMEPMLAAFGDVVRSVKLRPPRVRFVSSLTGTVVHDEVTAPEYWVRQVRERVRFGDALLALARDGVRHHLEIGPGAALAGLGRAAADGGVWIAGLRPGRSAWASLAEALARLYVAGVEIDWRAVDREEPRRRVSLPTYPWERTRFWPDAPVGRRAAAVPLVAAREHPLLARRAGSPLVRETIFESDVDLASMPLLADHRVFAQVVVPGAFHLSLLLGVARAVHGTVACELTGVRFPGALVLGESETATVQAVVAPGAESGEVTVISLARETGEPVVHAHARLARRPTRVLDDDVASIRERLGDEEPGERLYQGLAERAIDLGPAFRWVRAYWRGAGEALGRLDIPEVLQRATPDWRAYVLHPGLIDSCLQLLLVAGGEDDARTFVPIGMGRLRLHDAPGPVPFWCHAELQPPDPREPDVRTAAVRLLDGTGQVIVEIDDLVLRRVDRESFLRGVVGARDALHEVAWHRASRPDVPARAEGAWLVVTDDVPLGETLAAGLVARGASATVAGAGEIVPGDAGHVVQVSAAHDDEACRTTLELARALAARSAPPRLTLVTVGAQRIGAERHRTVPFGAMVWGLGRTLGVERPDLRCRLIDLDPDPAADRAGDLLAAVLDDETGREVAVRGGVFHVPRLARMRPGAGTARAIADDATYLVTGGLGDLGLVVAGWLVERGARNLALAGRHAPSEAAQARLAALRTRGVTVATFEADITDADVVGALFARLEVEMPPLRGVVHAAGVLDDAPLAALDWPRARRVLAPKVQGSLNLHRAVEGRPLDFFVLFSSAAALLGSPGQAAYAAGNAFMDALAAMRRAAGLPATSIGWGPWGEVGMAARAGAAARERWNRLGVRTLSTARALAALADVLDHDAVHAAVLALDAARLARAFPEGAAPPVLAGLLATSPPPAGGTADPIATRLRAAPPGARRDLVAQYLGERVAAVLGLAPREVPVDEPIGTLGLDSLMALELQTRIAAELGRRIPLGDLLGDVTIASLAGVFADGQADDRDAVAEPAASDVVEGEL